MKTKLKSKDRVRKTWRGLMIYILGIKGMEYFFQ